MILQEKPITMEAEHRAARTDRGNGVGQTGRVSVCLPPDGGCAGRCGLRAGRASAEGVRRMCKIGVRLHREKEKPV